MKWVFANPIINEYESSIYDLEDNSWIDEIQLKLTKKKNVNHFLIFFSFLNFLKLHIFLQHPDIRNSAEGDVIPKDEFDINIEDLFEDEESDDFDNETSEEEDGEDEESETDEELDEMKISETDEE